MSGHMRVRALGLGLVVLLLAGSLLLAGCRKATPTPAPAPAATPKPAATPTPVAKVWKLKVQAYTAKGLDPQWVDPEKVAEFIRAETGGRVDITVYPMMELVPTREIPSAVAQGVLDGGIQADAYISASYPLLEWAKNPSVISTPQDYYKVLDAGVRDKMDALLAKDKMKLASVWELTDIVVYAARDKHIKTLEDFKGRRMRGAGGITDEFVKANGTGLVVLPMAEVYTAAQTGVIDSMWTGLPGYMGMKGYEVTPYITWAKGAGGTFNVFMLLNMDLWNSFPADIQQAFQRAEKKHQAWHIKYMEQYLVDSVKYFNEHGAQVITLSPEEVARWRQSFEKVGIPFFLGKAGEPGREVLQIVEKTLGKKILP